LARHHASEQSQRDPSVSVVVPVRNGGAPFEVCLTRIARAFPAPREVIVVADGDSDGSWRVAERYGGRVLRLAAPGGPARARNEGARAAGGDVVFFVDADVAIAPDAVGQVTKAFRTQPDLAAVFGSYDDAPSEGNFLSRYKNLLHHYVHQSAREEAFTFWAGCGAVRRDTFLALGGFDERYRNPSIEDIELGYRLRKAGHRVRLCKALQGTHLKRWGVLSLLKSDFLHRALPWTDLILRHGRMANDLNLTVSGRLSVALSGALLASLLGAFLWPVLLLAAGAAAAALVWLNADLYRFFWRKHGPWFALGTLPWHWFYFLYSGAAFLIGTVRHALGGTRSTGPPVTEAGPGAGAVKRNAGEP
jgi:glycosyltransferase involved in cell wall biosynthesis